MIAALLTSLAAAQSDLPLAPSTLAPAASAAAHGTLALDAALVAGTDGSALAGGAVAARWWPTQRLHAAATASAGAGFAACPSCGGASAGLAVRGNLIEQPWLHLGGYVLAEGLSTPSLSGQLTAGASAASQLGPITLSATVPLASTAEIVEMVMLYPELGITARYAERHATRLATQGAHGRLILTHRWTTARGWLGGHINHAGTDTTVGLQAGLPLR